MEGVARAIRLLADPTLGAPSIGPLTMLVQHRAARPAIVTPVPASATLVLGE